MSKLLCDKGIHNWKPDGRIINFGCDLEALGKGDTEGYPWVQCLVCKDCGKITSYEVDPECSICKGTGWWSSECGGTHIVGEPCYKCMKDDKNAAKEKEDG